MKEKRYRVKLKDGRIVGPFFKEDIGALYLKGHMEGEEKCQYFPVGDWAPIQEFKELFDYLHEIVDKDFGKNDFDEVKEFEYEKKTQIDIDYSELEKKIISSDKKNFEETRIVRKKPSADIDKTIVKNVQQQKLESEPENKIEKEEEEAESPEEKEEQVNVDAHTKVFNPRSDMEIVQKEVEKFEMESARKMEEGKKKGDSSFE